MLSLQGYFIRISTALFFVFISSNQVFGQKKDYQTALAYYSIDEYSNALYYATVSNEKKPSSKCALLIARCSQKLRNPKNAEKYYKRVIRSGRHETSVLLEYAQVLKSLAKYSLARKYIEQYGSKKGLSESIELQNLISSCDSAMNWTDNPKLVSIANLKKINSAASDVAPTFYEDGIVFSSARENTIIKYRDGKTGQPYYDLYTATRKEGKEWDKVRSFSSKINSIKHEGAAVFDTTFSVIYFTRSHKLKKDTIADRLKLYKSTKNGEHWSDPETFMLNDSTSSFGHPAIYKNDKLFIFASDMPGGYGGIDLWASFNVDGVWKYPINLGPEVNTKGNEIYPFIHPDGYLYFASDGHIGMGGFDIYRTRLKKGDWTEVKNMGAPINSGMDDCSLVIDKNRRKGFFSSNRLGGRGSEDIYEFRSKAGKL